jgi:hypothetical protein
MKRVKSSGPECWVLFGLGASVGEAFVGLGLAPAYGGTESRTPILATKKAVVKVC